MERDASVRETYRNILIYARAIVGDERLLAERLGVNPQQVLNWTNGIEPVPAEIFLKTVDIVATATPEDIQRSRQVFISGNLFPARKSRPFQRTRRGKKLRTRPNRHARGCRLRGLPRSAVETPIRNK